MRCSIGSHGRTGGTLGAILIAAAMLVAPSSVLAHDVPTDVLVRAFVAPRGDTLQFLLRVPLESFQDYIFPQFGTGFLDIAAADPMLRQAAMVWLGEPIKVYENGGLLGEPSIAALRVSLPSDRSFSDLDRARAHLRDEPLPASTRLPWQQAMLDVWFEYPIDSDQSQFAIDPAFERLSLRTTTVLLFDPPDSPERVYQFIGYPGRVPLDPSWLQSVFRFAELGFFHILDGVDHLLFLLCLVIPIRSFRKLVPIVTSFTVAHSITLIASALGLAPNALWFPPLIEMLIALSIVYMAFENIIGARLDRRWLIAFAFGLVHGFGFSFLLRDTLQFAGGHLLTALLSFNLGVEIGQLFVLALTVPLLAWLFRRVVDERAAAILLSALVAHSAWHWMGERWAQLRAYDFRWPALDMLLLATLARWLMLMAILAGAVWLLFLIFGGAGERRGETPEPLVAGEE
ncbi:MAG: HupE/UreJ family protein [Acidobacteriota bacterium]